MPLVLHGADLARDRARSSTGYHFTWHFQNYTDALSNYDDQFIRSFVYAGLATIIALLIGYPLAYAIAFRGGKWKNALLLLVILPFFVTYLIRTLSWETILDDDGHRREHAPVARARSARTGACSPPRAP